MTKCAAPSCGNDAPGRHGIFCVDHYFQLPRTYTGLLTRMKIECSRCDDADKRKHLDEQLAAYIRVVIGKLPPTPEARTSQAALDSARRPSEPAAGAPAQRSFL